MNIDGLYIHYRSHQVHDGAQLIFTSHNTNMLKKKLRRDQMIFVEKDKYGVSTMDSLYHKSPKIRNDASFDKDYLLGKYGAYHFCQRN
jgi:uncharacterized protein